MTDTLVPAETIDDAIAFVGAYEVSVYTNYSGRFMYGAQCFGLVGSISDITKVLIGVASADADLALELANAQRQDDMGMSTIIYFPGFSLEGEPQDAGD